MKTRFKSIVSIFTSAVILATGALSVPTFAVSGSTSTTNVALEKTNFSEKWELTWTFTIGNGKGSMRVGFETWELTKTMSNCSELSSQNTMHM